MSFLDNFLNNPLPSKTTEPVLEGEDDVIVPPVNGGLDTDPIDDDDIEGEEPEIDDDMEKPESLELSPEEEAEADSIINIAATPVILNEILSKESVAEFVESSEFDIAVSEGFALEGTKENFLSDDNSIFMEAKFYAHNMMRLTKDAKRNQLFEICIQAIARAKNDPVYFKLNKVQEMRRKLKAVLRQRYKGPAMRKANEYLMRMKNSGSKTISDAAKKMN